MDKKFISCPDCKGHGYISGGDEHSSWSRTCDRCHGTGYAMVPKTRADRIREKSDEELAVWIQSLLYVGDTGFHCQEKKECQELLDQEGKDIPEEWCTKCMVAWLQQPVPAQMPRRIFEDKQESGLLEE